MAVTRYHRYIGELWEDLNLEELVSELSDFLLQSGFGHEIDDWDEDSLQSLHDAILEALMRKGLLSDEDLEKLMADQDALEQFLQKAVERLVREGYLKTSEGRPFHDPTGGGSTGRRVHPSASSSPRRRSTSSASAPSGTSSARSARPPWDATTPGISPPASRPPDPPRTGSSATR